MSDRNIQDSPSFNDNNGGRVGRLDFASILGPVVQIAESIARTVGAQSGCESLPSLTLLEENGRRGDGSNPTVRERALLQARDIIVRLGARGLAQRERASEQLNQFLRQNISNPAATDAIREIVEQSHGSDPEVCRRINATFRSILQTGDSRDAAALLSHSDTTISQYASGLVQETDNLEPLLARVSRGAAALPDQAARNRLHESMRTALQRRYGEDFDETLFRGGADACFGANASFLESNRDLELGRLSPAQREERIRRLIADAQQLVSSTDERCNGDTGALAQHLYPAAERQPAGLLSASGLRFVQAPGQARLVAASVLSDAAERMAALPGANQETIDRLVERASTYLRDAFASTPECCSHVEVVAAAARLRQASPTVFDRIIPAEVRQRLQRSRPRE